VQHMLCGACLRVDASMFQEARQRWKGKRVLVPRTQEVGEVLVVLPVGPELQLRSAATGALRWVKVPEEEVEDITTPRWERDRALAPQLRGEWVRLKPSAASLSEPLASSLARYEGLRAFVSAVDAPVKRDQEEWRATVRVPGTALSALPALPLDALYLPEPDAKRTAAAADGARELGGLVWLDVGSALLAGDEQLLKAQSADLRFTSGPFAYAPEVDASDCPTPGVLVTLDGAALLGQEAGALRPPAELVAAREARTGARAASVASNQYAAAPWRLQQTRARAGAAAGLSVVNPALPLGAYVQTADIAPCPAARLGAIVPDWRFRPYVARPHLLGTLHAAKAFAEWADTHNSVIRAAITAARLV
jgi:hypothetical protein